MYYNVLINYTRKKTPTYITAHFCHFERVQGFGVTHVDPHCLLLVLCVALLVFNLKQQTTSFNFLLLPLNISLSH